MAYLTAMRHALAMPFLILAVLTPGGAAAQEATIRTYPVTGSTFRELLASMRENGPFVERTGRTHFGITETSLGWTGSYQRTRAGCELLDVDVRLDLTIVLPEWTDRAGASARTIERWERLYDDIVQHEERHAEIAREYVGKLRDEIDRSVTATSCPALEAGLMARSKIVIDRHRNAQRTFDGLPPIAD